MSHEKKNCSLVTETETYIVYFEFINSGGYFMYRKRKHLAISTKHHNVNRNSANSVQYIKNDSGVCLNVNENKTGDKLLE